MIWTNQGPLKLGYKKCLYRLSTIFANFFAEVKMNYFVDNF